MMTRGKRKVPTELTVLDVGGDPMTALPPPDPVDVAYEEVQPSTCAAIIAGHARDIGRLAKSVLGRA